MGEKYLCSDKDAKSALASGENKYSSVAIGEDALEFKERGCKDSSNSESIDNEPFLEPDVNLLSGLDGTTTVLGGMFIVANAAIGCGTLAFPFAFQGAGGLSVGIALVFLCAMMCVLSLIIIGYACAVTGTSHFYECSGALLGKVAEVFAQLLVIVVSVGVCIMYLVIMGDQWELINFKFSGYDYYCDDTHWWLHRKTMITVSSLCIVFPLCLVKKVDFLKYPSMLSVFSMVYVMIAVAIKYYQTELDPDTPLPVLRDGPDSCWEVLSAFPTILFGYQCMQNAGPVYGNLKTKTMTNWTLVVMGTVFICTIVYLPTAIFGYLTIGPTIKSNILQSYDPRDNLIFVAQAMVLLSVMMTYPVVYYVARTSLDPMYVSFRCWLNKSYNPMESEAVRRLLTATIWYVLCLMIALYLPSIAVAINFTGSLASFFYLVYPGAYLIRISSLNWPGLGNWKSRVMCVVGVLMVSLGLFLFVQGIIGSVASMDKPPEPTQCVLMAPTAGND